MVATSAERLAQLESVGCLLWADREETPKCMPSKLASVAILPDTAPPRPACDKSIPASRSCLSVRSVSARRSMRSSRLNISSRSRVNHLSLLLSRTMACLSSFRERPSGPSHGLRPERGCKGKGETTLTMLMAAGSKGNQGKPRKVVGRHPGADLEACLKLLGEPCGMLPNSFQPSDARGQVLTLRPVGE